jgi:class 3 adenylate cyclase
MAKLTAKQRAQLPDRAFAHVGADGERRLPIHDEAHVRNALARFERVAFPDEASRDRARRRLLAAAKKLGILPIGFIDGQLRAAQGDPSKLPTGAVAFLLTDIERSTALLRALGDDYAHVLRDVRAAIRQAVRAAGGHKVDATGDGFFAAFEDASGALGAAIDLQRRLAAHTWPAEVRVRAGVHMGRPTLTDSGYIGLAVNTAARVCAAAHGGQILVSGATKAALAGGLPAGVRLRSLGRHRLAGLPRAEVLYQVEGEGLRRRFPAPRPRAK